MYKYFLCFVSLFFSNFAFSSYFDNMGDYNNFFGKERSRYPYNNGYSHINERMQSNPLYSMNDRIHYDDNNQFLKIDYSNLVITDDAVAASLGWNLINLIKTSQAIKAISNVIHWYDKKHIVTSVEINLNNNTICDEGAIDLCQYVSGLPFNYITLYLVNNRIGEEGVTFLINNLIDHAINVQKLDIRDNPGADPEVMEPLFAELSLSQDANRIIY